MTNVVVCFGLLTLDHMLRVDRLPGSNEKIVAAASDFDFGGPAANAAATAAALGSQCRLITATGEGPLTRLATDRLSAQGVEVRDLLAHEPGDPAISTVLITKATGDRAVVSINATGVRDDLVLEGDELDSASLLLVDGHHMQSATELARVAQDRGIPVLFDGGSWKPGTDELVRHVDIAVVSGDFVVPQRDDVAGYLSDAGCRFVARTAGPKPIVAAAGPWPFEVEVAKVDDVEDTLGAGDVLHGALAHYFASGPGDFEEALRSAAVVASESCRYPGAHGWFGRLS